jgi:hypothetical protein
VAERDGREDAMTEKHDRDPRREPPSKGSLLSRLVDLLLGAGWLLLLVYLFIRFLRRVWL